MKLKKNDSIVSYQDLLKFSTNITVEILEKKEIDILFVSYEEDIKYPNVIYKQCEINCCMRLLPFFSFTAISKYEKEKFAELTNLARKQNAIAILRPVELFYMDTEGGAGINGGTVAVKFFDAIVA